MFFDWKNSKSSKRILECLIGADSWGILWKQEDFMVKSRASNMVSEEEIVSAYVK